MSVAAPGPGGPGAAATGATGATVAIVGAGPAGLAAARWLGAVGFHTTLFEQHDGVGGQWRVGAPGGGVWPGMRTNTSRVMTAFADLPPEPGPTYPSAEAIGAYLERYAAGPGAPDVLRLGTRVEEVEPDAGAWRVRTREGDAAPHTARFTHVVAAPGRYRRPALPPVPGLAAFTGVGGVSHAADYRGADAYRGRRVLVVGHSISALEIAAELAMRGAARVLVAARRHRYVLQKLLAGVPIDHRVYTRAAALAAETYPRAATSAALRALIVQTSGHPAQFGAPCASDDPLEAGFTQNQFYLPLVAEGRIVPCAGLVRVDGDVAHLADGRAEAVDAVVCATGYTLDLPFLGPTAREALGPGAVHAALYQHTFHPALPGLALVGVYHQSGPYFPTIELQARWVAYAWSGRVAPPSPETMAAGVAAARTAGDAAPMLRMHGWALALARAAGVEPDAARWPSLARALLFGPLSPASFRLDGPDALHDAPGRVAEDAAAYGALVGSPAATALGADERARLRALAAARGDLALRALAEAGAEGAAAPGGSDGAGTLAPSTPTPLAR